VIWLGFYIGVSLAIGCIVAYLAWLDEFDGLKIVVLLAVALWPLWFLMIARDIYQGRRGAA
jgi:hypothetical protein